MKHRIRTQHHTEDLDERGRRVSLGAVRNGETVHIHRLEGGHHFMSRLASLGFTPGVRLQMVQNRRRGPIIVSVRDTRVALGRGEAGKIVVDRVAEDDDGR
jgi:ferrous iron transport protein A